MYAIVEINGFQYKVQENQTLEITNVKDFEKGQKVEIDKVLFLKDENKSYIGKPYVEGAKVIFQFAEQKKGKKIEVMKFRRRSNYKKIKGYRDLITVVKIDKILTP